MADNTDALNVIDTLQKMGLLAKPAESILPATNPTGQDTVKDSPVSVSTKPNTFAEEPVTKPSDVSDEATRLNTAPVPSKQFAPATISSAPGDVVGTTSEYNNANNEELTTTKQASAQKFNADKAKADRLYTANVEYVDKLAESDKDHIRDRELAHKTAAVETAHWMQEMDEKAAKKPSPGNWWHNTSSFGKAMWLLSLAFSTKAASLGAKNVIADMISNEIDEDMARQKESLNKQLEVSRLKGQHLLANQSQTLGDMNDDYTHKVGRLNALLAANTVKAASTTNEDLKAQYAQIDADISARKTAVASKRLDNAYHERLSEAEQKHQDKRESIRLGFEHNENAIKQMFESGQNDLNRKMHYNLAEESASAKIAAAEAKAAKKQDLHEFPSQSGVSIRVPGKNGEPDQVGNFAIPKDQAEKAGEIIRSGQAKLVATAALRDAISEHGLPFGAIHNSNEARQALAALSDPMIKQMGGRFNKDTAKAMNDLSIGEDPSSMMQRLKGDSKEDILKLLDKEIREGSGAIKQQLLGIPGSNLADHPDAELIFTSPDTRGAKEHELSNDEKIENATGESPNTVLLKSSKDVKEYGDEAEKHLPNDLRSIIDDAKTKLQGGFDKSNTSIIYKSAVDKIESWNDKAMDSDEDGSTAYQNSRLILQETYKKAQEVADKLPEIKALLKFKQDSGSFGSNGVSRDDVEEEVTKAGLVVPVQEIKAITDELRKTSLSGAIRGKNTYTNKLVDRPYEPHVKFKEPRVQYKDIVKKK